MKKVILIAGSFTSANVNVMLSVIRAMYEKPEIHIVAVKYFNNEQFPKEDDIKCYPVSSWRWQLSQTLKYSKYFKFLCRIINAFFFYLYRILDNYIPSALEKQIYRKCCEIAQGNEIEQVFSVCCPFYTHRVAARVSKKEHIQWTPVWLDSYSNGNCKQSKIWELSALYYEKKVFSKAPQIFSLHQSFIGNKLISQFERKIKYFRIPYVMNIEVHVQNKNIVYAGLLGDANRNPTPVLNMFKKAIPYLNDDVCFHFYVRNPEDYKQYEVESSNRIQFHGFVPRKELVRILSEAYMLISIGNAISFQLPSKVIENISYRKPILFLYSQESDPSFEYYNDYPDIFQQDIRNVKDTDVLELAKYINREHSQITYSDLMQKDIFRECTPQFVKNVFLNNH